MSDFAAQERACTSRPNSAYKKQRYYYKKIIEKPELLAVIKFGKLNRHATILQQALTLEAVPQNPPHPPLTLPSLTIPKLLP